MGRRLGSQGRCIQPLEAVSIEHPLALQRLRQVNQSLLIALVSVLSCRVRQENQALQQNLTLNYMSPLPAEVLVGDPQAAFTELTASTKQQRVLLVQLGDASDDDSQDGQTGLLNDTMRCLLHPKVPLSAAAAVKLQHQPLLGQELHWEAGRALKSLPGVLLYDDAGLDLFDKITYLPEYYLTEAEADILARSGADIVSSCVQDDALLVELGAGSMRKTRLLLDAVRTSGRQGVTFAALDLCRLSLHQALSGLQGCCGDAVEMIGFVGTYDEGLDYIWEQQQQQQDKQQNNKQQMQFVRPSKANAAPAGPEGDTELAGLLLSSDDAESIAADCLAGDAPRVILWLGSSIGNWHRDQAAPFLRQVKDKALRPGDYLLVGIDQRNACKKVAAAYNDSEGVHRKFILNGLKHLSRVLDVQHMHGNTDHSKSSGVGTSSLCPEHFDYFCLYNEDLGRHESYCQALVDTAITLPAPLGSMDGCSSRVTVPVVAGELISMVFSYKYSLQEVEQLAAAAGLVHVKNWTDSQHQYRLYLLQRAE